MSVPNWAPKTIWTGDNLPILRGLNSASVDLIYLDPPFNSKANYAAPIGSPAAGAAFKDTWGLSDVDAEWINLIEARYPAVYRVLLAAMTDGDKSYLAYMAARLLELHRVLKPTGSIYLHCDPTMSHYLKLLMDAVFGRAGAQGFRNEVTWQRTGAHNDPRRYGAISDRLLFFTKSDTWTWNRQYMPYTPEYIKQRYRYDDGDGRLHWRNTMTAPGHGRGSAARTFRGELRDPPAGTHWRFSQERIDAMEAENRIYYSASGMPYVKSYLDEQKGRPAQDVWTDVAMPKSGKERIGYPTQKPLALLRRIIEASSNPGDMVLDPFCGCATTCVAADDLGRNWAGIDISPTAADLVVRRIADRQGLFRDIVHRRDIPKRSDLGRLPGPRTHRRTLYGDQAGDCAGCGQHFELRHLEVDHIVARATGGTDHIENLQLLCGACNRVKGDRGMAYLRVKLQLR